MTVEKVNVHYEETEKVIEVVRPEPGEELAKIEILVGCKAGKNYSGCPSAVQVFYNGKKIEHLTHFAFVADIDSVPTISVKKLVYESVLSSERIRIVE